MRYDLARHNITVCNRCVDPRLGTPAGATLKTNLVALLANDERESLCIEYVGCMAGCGRPTAVAFTAPGKATYLFGDIDPATDAPDLLAFARLYRMLPDGWCNEGQRPRALAGKTLARVPAVRAMDAAT